MDPLQRFRDLLARAKQTPGIPEPTGMTLSTVGPDGRPSARIVLLKGLDDEGFVFYTNQRSRKGREVIAHPDVALTFWWPPLEEQVRIEGRAGRVTDAEADAYFASRRRGSQLGAWASHQSEELSSRAELEARLVAITAQYEGKPVPRPPHWSGFRVVPSAIEFWKNRQDRLHEREVYSRAGAGWTMQLLNP